MSEGNGALVKALTKDSYRFINFSDRPVSSFDFSKFSFSLKKKTHLGWKDLGPRWIPIWNPIMRAVYTERSLPGNWHPERQLIGTLNAHTHCNP
jgi:hypothetical protein